MEIEKDNVNNKLELIKGLTDVKSGIKEEITPDFVLSKNSAQEKEGAIEMTNNAYFIKKILENYVKKKKIWEWENKQWIKRGLNEKEKDKCQKVINQLFESIMIRITMLQILNRNQANNHLVRIVAGLEEQEQMIDDDMKDTGKKLKESAKEIIKPEKN